jgi:hypothetical protein
LILLLGSRNWFEVKTIIGLYLGTLL